MLKSGLKLTTPAAVRVATRSANAFLSWTARRQLRPRKYVELQLPVPSIVVPVSSQEKRALTTLAKPPSEPTPSTTSSWKPIWDRWRKPFLALVGTTALGAGAFTVAVVLNNKSRIPNQFLFEVPRSYVTLTGDHKDDMYHAPAAPPPTFVEGIIGQIQLLGRIIKLGVLFLPVFATMPCALLPWIHKAWWRWLRWSLESAGGCWIKLGQWASTRPDLFPEEFVKSVENLQDRCPSHSLAATRNIIRKNLKLELEEAFDLFVSKPIASGSMAQVYKAKLKMTGQPVAVKVLHPNIENIVRLDLKIMAIGARVISVLPTTQFLMLPEAIEEFSSRMQLQTDLRGEAHNLKIFNRNFKGDKYVVFPTLIEEYSSQQCLVESFEHGIPLNTYLKHKPAETSIQASQKKAFAKMGLHAYLKMMLTDNFVHADLHPGNILIRISNNKQELVMLDVGLVSQLSPNDWQNFKDLFTCIVQGNGKAGAELMATRARQSTLKPEQKELFLKEMDVLFSTIRSQKLSEISVGAFLTDIMSVVRKYRVQIEPNFATLCVATVVLEGIGRQLDPNINILDQAVPYLLWSGKANLRDMSMFVREKVKDELYTDDRIRIPEKRWFWSMWQLVKDVVSD